MLDRRGATEGEGTVQLTITRHDPMRYRCETSHARDHTVGRRATWDLGRYMRVSGIPGMVRFICDDCARGIYLGKKARRLEVA